MLWANVGAIHTYVDHPGEVELQINCEIIIYRVLTDYEAKICVRCVIRSVICKFSSKDISMYIDSDKYDVETIRIIQALMEENCNDIWLVKELRLLMHCLKIEDIVFLLVIKCVLAKENLACIVNRNYFFDQLLMFL
jgi:hypothetical protein